MQSEERNKTLKIAFVSTYPPRQCGIATFTADLRGSLYSLYQDQNRNALTDEQMEVVALNDNHHQLSYGKEVVFQIRRQHRGDYQRAADFLNFSEIDVVSLQHEFGIFGGENGNYALYFLEHLQRPVVTTLHTVLREPEPGQKRVLTRICALSSLVVVLSEAAKGLLHEVYGVPGEKIVMIHHGTPDVPFLDPSYYKDQFQAEGKKLLLTFGLLSPGKGLEYAIEAMAEVVKKVPDALYIILGATHPEVKRRFGEQYRHHLESKVREYGLQEHVAFYNQYVTLDRLIQFLVAADIYISPYVSPEQVVSGTLAYAVACGKAVVSTPYWYAREILSEGRGRLVPFRDSKALAGTLIELLSDEMLRNRMRKRAYRFGRRMIWSEVAAAYAATLEKAPLLYGSRLVAPANALAVTRQHALPEINLQHLQDLSDDTGLFQHAVYNVPDRDHGYCVDDNARALIVTLQNWQLFKDEAVLPLVKRYLGFIKHAFNPVNGRFRNFMGFKREWLEEAGSEDSHGRALWALGYAVAYPTDDGVLGLAARLFRQASEAAAAFVSLRGWAFSILGAYYYLKRFGGDIEVQGVLSHLSGKLKGQFLRHAREGWYWAEETVTYDNARLPQALIAAGERLEDQEAVEIGLKALEWLVEIQKDPAEGHLSLVGNNGWFKRGGEKAAYDQQPLDAAALVDACYQAYLYTGEERWRKGMDWAFNWFFGDNDAHQVLYDFAGGGCYDGLQPGGVNQNRGGESCVSFLMALHRLHLFAARRLLEETYPEPS